MEKDVRYKKYWVKKYFNVEFYRMGTDGYEAVSVPVLQNQIITVEFNIFGNVASLEINGRVIAPKMAWISQNLKLLRENCVEITTENDFPTKESNCS